MLIDHAAARLNPTKHTLVVLVENKPGVLNRVASLFRRRNFNIDSLAVGTTDDPAVSRMTIVVDTSKTSAALISTHAVSPEFTVGAAAAGTAVWAKPDNGTKITVNTANHLGMTHLPLLHVRSSYHAANCG